MITSLEMMGFGRILFQARDCWPDYMSCVLVVCKDLIDKRAVQVLVDGMARSGLTPFKKDFDLVRDLMPGDRHARTKR